MVRHTFMGCVVMLGMACSPTGGAVADAGSSVPDAGSGDGVIDPAVFDCRSLGPDGGAVPARASPVPVSCLLDPACRTPMVSAHRGAGGQLGNIAPEDSLSAYRAAIAYGVDFVETDPRPTSDGVIVNIHDTTVDRTTMGTGQVDQMTLAQVQALPLRTGTLAGDFSCDRVPTLVDILRTARGRAVVLVDANKTDRVDLLVQAIRDADALDWAIFDTSSLSKIDEARALEPGIRFHIRPALADITAQLDYFAPALPVNVELEYNDVDEGAPLVHARGTRVMSNVFNVDVLVALGTDDNGGYDAVLDDGADILQTDRPLEVIRVLKRRGAR